MFTITGFKPNNVILENYRQKYQENYRKILSLSPFFWQTNCLPLQGGQRGRYYLPIIGHLSPYNVHRKFSRLSVSIILAKNFTRGTGTVEKMKIG